MNQIKSIVSIATIKKIAISFMFLFFSGAFSYISALDIESWDAYQGLVGVYRQQLGPGIIGDLLNDIDQGSNNQLLGMPG
ncbi:MAG: hypothetical protein LBT79_03390, partial [Elusimicrobiota bacterium]|nr:hypothetical protein [Elusimicrobiota bacterium]